MGYQGHFHDLQRIVVKSIKAISYKLTMPVSANQFSHIQPFPIFKIFDSSSPFYKCKPYVARNKRQRQHYMQFDSLKGTNGLLTTMELVPQMMIKTKKENTPGKELTFRVTLGGATSGIETSQISQVPAKQVNESDGLSNRVFLKDQEDQFFIVNDRNGTSFAGSDARSGSEVREAKIIRNEVRNPKFLKRQSIIFTSILAVSYFVAMITRVFLDSENTSIMRDALAQNEKVLLLTQAINPISALFKETIWATMQNDAGVSFDRLGHNLLDATKFAARIKLSEAYLASNYTDVKTTYFTTLTQGNETVYVVSNLKYSLYTLIHLLDFHIAALTTNTKSVMDAHRDDTSSTGYSPVSFNEFMLMINDPIARVRLISRTIFYSMWDKLVSLSDLNTKSSRNASSWTLILATFITSLVLIGAFLLIMVVSVVKRDNIMWAFKRNCAEFLLRINKTSLETSRKLIQSRLDSSMKSMDETLKSASDYYKDGGGSSITKQIDYPSWFDARKKILQTSNHSIFRTYAKYPGKKQRGLYIGLVFAFIVILACPLISIIVARVTIENTLVLLDLSISFGLVSSSVSVYIALNYANIMYVAKSKAISKAIVDANKPYLDMTKKALDSRSFILSSRIMTITPTIGTEHLCETAGLILGSAYIPDCLASVNYKTPFNLPNALEFIDFSYKEIVMMVERGNISDVYEILASNSFRKTDRTAFYTTAASLYHTEYLVHFLSRNYHSLGLDGWIWALIWTAVCLLVYSLYYLYWLLPRDTDWMEIECCILVLNDYILSGMPALMKILN